MGKEGCSKLTRRRAPKGPIHTSHEWVKGCTQRGSHIMQFFYLKYHHSLLIGLLLGFSKLNSYIFLVLGMMKFGTLSQVSLTLFLLCNFNLTMVLIFHNCFLRLRSTHPGPLVPAAVFVLVWFCVLPFLFMF